MPISLKKKLLLLFFWIRDSRIWLARKAIELVFIVFRVTLLANYVEAKKIINLELVPTYLVKRRNKEIALAKELLEGEGDKIT